MDVEKTVRLLLEQQAASVGRMCELHTIVEQMALNQVALGKAPARFDSNMRTMQATTEGIQGNMREFQGNMRELQENMRGLQEGQKRTDQTVDRLGVRVDRLVQALQSRFGTNGSTA